MSVDLAGVVNYILSRISKTTKPIWYPGGDWYVKDIILSLLIRAPCKRCTLVEVFGGSGVISQFAPRSKFKAIIYNDIDKMLTNLFTEVKNNPELLAYLLSLIPYSREVYDILIKYRDTDVPGIIGATIAFYLINSSFMGKIGAGFATSKTTKCNETLSYATRVKSILEASKRFRDVTIECLDFTECIQRYDSEDTVFYLDPPYIEMESKGRDEYYRYGFTLHQARRLVSILNNIRGYYVLKLHNDQLKYYTGLNYKHLEKHEKALSMEKVESGERKTWTMVLLSNYKPTHQSLQFFEGLSNLDENEE